MGRDALPSRARSGERLRLDFYKELYFFEWTRKEQLASATNLPVGILAALVAGLLFLVQSFPYRSGTTAVLFVLCTALSATAQALAAFFIVRALLGYWYQQLADSQDLRAYHRQLVSWHQVVGGSRDEADRDFDLFLEERLTEATDANRRNNTRIGDALDNATRAIVGALLFAALSVAPYLAATLESSSTISSEVAMPQGSEPRPQPTTQPQPPPRPQGPANQQVRKGGGRR